jgi:RNA polymerase sigma-70 factor (ECF subfamily)
VHQETEDETGAWAALLTRAAQGDVDAFESFYLRSAHWALALARQLVGESEAEEFMAFFYIQAWQHAASFDHARTAAGDWLDALARRLAAAR